MSWTASYKINSATGGVTDSNESGVEGNFEHRDQYVVAVAMANQIIESGCVGDPDGIYRVALSGHGNPSHEPTPGWSNDFIGVSVYQVIE